MKRVLVIGDIHGGLRALLQVMERAAVSGDEKLIFLGDYVDGWSDSAAVIDYLKDLSSRQSCIFLKGNHDAWCEDWLRTGMADQTWIFNGGKTTVESYKTLYENARQQHLVFFEGMKLYEIDSKNRLFIHAGFTSANGPAQEFNSANLSWDRSLWETALMLDKLAKKKSLPYPKPLNLFDEIYIGHTPTLYYNKTEPMQACNVWNIDTGAAFTGKLSILEVETKRFWQSDAVKNLYPGEKGRNKK
jgi:serine/threonine protein phosphatase 1